jgi:hypothetical protein
MAIAERAHHDEHPPARRHERWRWRPSGSPRRPLSESATPWTRSRRQPCSNLAQPHTPERRPSRASEGGKSSRLPSGLRVLSCLWLFCRVTSPRPLKVRGFSDFCSAFSMHVVPILSCLRSPRGTMLSRRGDTTKQLETGEYPKATVTRQSTAHAPLTRGPPFRSPSGPNFVKTWVRPERTAPLSRRLTRELWVAMTSKVGPWPDSQF